MLSLKNLVLLSLTLILTCFSVAQAQLADRPFHDDKPKKKVEESIDPIMIRVTGYGAYEKKEDANSESKRLMAIRASKLDAYRALAERLYGIGISGGSSVKGFVLKSDTYSTVVDSYVRGARVVSIIENKGRGFETVLEVLLPGEFQDCINKVNSIKYDEDCLRPLPMSGSHDVSSKTKTPPKMQSLYHLK